MKYMLLIHQGETPTPRDPEAWARLSEEDRAAVFVDGELIRLTESPVVELNRTIALAEARGPQAGPEIVDRLGLDEFHYLHAARAELLGRLGRTSEARASYERALALAPSEAERRLLERKLSELPT